MAWRRCVRGGRGSRSGRGSGPGVHQEERTRPGNLPIPQFRRGRPTSFRPRRRGFRKVAGPVARGRSMGWGRCGCAGRRSRIGSCRDQPAIGRYRRAPGRRSSPSGAPARGNDAAGPRGWVDRRIALRTPARSCAPAPEWAGRPDRPARRVRPGPGLSPAGSRQAPAARGRAPATTRGGRAIPGAGDRAKRSPATVRLSGAVPAAGSSR